MTGGWWETQGCVACRASVLTSIGDPPLVRLGESDGPIFLYRCARCGAYWEENWREAHVIAEAQARERFPDARFDKPPA